MAVAASAPGEQTIPEGVNVKLLIGILVAAAFVVILNETTLSVALPELMREFRISAEAAQWLTTAFLLTMASIIPTTGFVLQRFTMRGVFLAALGTFLVGTLLAAAAPTFIVLLIARVVQAAGTALVIPLLMTTTMRLVPISQRGQVFGFITVVIAAAPALGPTFSGVVLQTLGWRWIFILVAPLVVVALVVGGLNIRNFEEPSRPRLDVVSVFLSVVGFSATLFGLAGLAELVDGVPWDRVGILAVGVVILWVFFARQLRLERSGGTPLLNLSPLRNRNYSWSMALLLLSFSSLFGFIILMPLLAQNVLGLSQLQTGLVTMPGGLMMALLGPRIGKAYDAKGARPLIIPGAVLLLLSMIGFAAVQRTDSWFGALGSNGTLLHLIVLAVLLNVGVSFMMTPLMSNALASVPPQLASHGQAILNTFQQVSGGAGTAMFVAIMTFAAGSYASRAGGSAGADAPEAAQAALGHGIEVAFTVGAVIAVFCLVVAVLVRMEARDAVPAAAPSAVPSDVPGGSSAEDVAGH